MKKKINYFYTNNSINDNNKKKKSNIKYLYYNKKLKKGLFLKKPTLNELSYPFLFNFKLISQFLNKK